MPYKWSGVELGVDNSVLTQLTSAADLLHAESVAAGWAAGDGTTQIQTVAPYVPTAGIYVNVWSAWRSALPATQYLQQGIADVDVASRVTSAYDGSHPGVGPLVATPSTSAGSFSLKYIEVRQV
jgi:hypothetical protein